LEKLFQLNLILNLTLIVFILPVLLSYLTFTLTFKSKLIINLYYKANQILDLSYKFKVILITISIICYWLIIWYWGGSNLVKNSETSYGKFIKFHINFANSI
jgi:hypothetical protein